MQENELPEENLTEQEKEQPELPLPTDQENLQHETGEVTPDPIETESEPPQVDEISSEENG